MTVPLRIERNPADGAHGDLLVTVASCQHRCDSYYFVIDESPAAPATIDGALARLLEQWLSDLAQIGTSGGLAFLPVDLSDQCSAWLRVASLEGDSVSVELGWTYVEGWSFVPSNYGTAATKIGVFEPIDGATFVAQFDDVVALIAALRDGFLASANDA